MHLHRKTLSILAEKGIERQTFEDVVQKACAALEEPAPNQRNLMNAALIANPGKRHLDLGGGTSIYVLMAHLFGTEVTVFDLMTELEEHRPNYERSKRRYDRCVEAGVTYVIGDLDDLSFGEGTYDGVSAFETIEHLPHSPRPVLERMMAALDPGGGITLSVPNIGRIENRMRMLRGANPLGKYPHFYRDGNPYLGHHREMRPDELSFIAGELGLERAEVFATEFRYSPIRNDAFRARMADWNDLWGDLAVPSGWRRRLFLRGHKPAAATTAAAAPTQATA